MSAKQHSKRIAIFMEMMDYLMVSVWALTNEVNTFIPTLAEYSYQLWKSGIKKWKIKYTGLPVRPRLAVSISFYTRLENYPSVW